MKHSAIVYRKKLLVSLITAATLSGIAALPAQASSHREAPFIATMPKLDGTDFYMFRSYEGVSATGTGGRSDYVTMIANYQPLQSPYGGPNYFTMDPNGLYEIHLDNDGDAKEDITFQFRFNNKLDGFGLDIGTAKNVAIPLTNYATNINDLKGTGLNLHETYGVKVVRGNRRTGAVSTVTKADGTTVYLKSQ